MGISSSVQFYGLPAVLLAYKNRDVDAWSLWQNKQFLFRGIGYDALEGYLNMLSEAGSGAVYTIKVYDDIEEEKKIKESTQADGSFNFRFSHESEYIPGQVGRHPIGTARQNDYAVLIGKIEALERKLSEREEEEPESKLGIIGEILEHPAMQPMLPKLVDMLGAFLTGGVKAADPNQAAINYPPPVHYNQGRSAVLNGVNDDSIINEAVTELKKLDPMLGIHLQKLVQIGKEDPSTFAMLINLLNQ